MLITELKNKDVIKSLITGKVFVLNCHGCREIHFPEHEADELLKELTNDGIVTGSLTTDYICNVDNLKLRLQKHAAAIEAADMILVLSCGVGVQTVAEAFKHHFSLMLSRREVDLLAAVAGDKKHLT